MGLYSQRYIFMSNLFSTFDPQSFLSLPLAWTAVILFTFFWPAKFWATPSCSISLINRAFLALKNEFITALGQWSHKSFSLLSLRILAFLVINNFLGLFPYIFTASRHLTFTLAIALPLWLGHIVIAWIKLPQRILAHLVPMGTPPVLIPFMVLIEITRSIIRPLTLSVRLAANIIAGHLLLTLLSQGAPVASFPVLCCCLTAVILLATLESAVALIQAYVFRVLRTLYLQEVNSPKITS